MIKIFAAILSLLMMSSVAAQDVADDVDRGVASVKQRTFDFSAETRFFAPNFNGQLKAADFRFDGERVDLRGDLNITRSAAPEILLSHKNFSLDWIHMHGAGKSFGTVNFGGQTLSGKLTARSDFHFVRMKLDRKIFSLMGTGIDWTVALNGVGWHGTGRDENSSASKNFFAVVPSVGLNLYVRFRPRWDLYVQFAGLPFGRRGHFADFEAGLKYLPRKNFSVGIGWRRIDFKLKRGGNFGNVVLNGPFVGLRYDF